MFYSHEILTNQQYGVATIWIVANVSANSLVRKVTRKAIQQVNVRKACEKIIEPGAPIALRLQGSLLYGLSRVYSHQCEYVLSDAEKVQNNMMTFFRSLPAGGIDPLAGKARPSQITLSDDTTFDPMAALPALELDDISKSFVALKRHITAKTSSYLSPATCNGSSPSDYRAISHPVLGLPLSGAGSYIFPSPFGKEGAAGSVRSSLAQDPFAEDFLEPSQDFEILFDADGNLVDPEARHPQRPIMREFREEHHDGATKATQGRKGEGAHENEDMFIIPEDALPDANPLPVSGHPQVEGTSESQEPSRVEETALQAATAGARRSRPKKTLHLDENPQISRDEYTSYTHHYLQNAAIHRARPAHLAALARENAFQVVFGIGIAKVSRAAFPGESHPLVDLYAGHGLESLVLSYTSTNSPQTGQRRSSQDAFGSSDYRRVRPRLGEETGIQSEAATAEHGLDVRHIDMAADISMEMGMDPVQVLEDHGSSLMPWNRHSSVVPSSAARSLGSAQRPMLGMESSPLAGRGLGFPPVERPSDSTVRISLEPDHRLGSGDADPGTGGGGDGGIAESLDTDSRDFLEFMAQQAWSMGRARPGDADPSRHWVSFEQMLLPASHSRPVAAQAFYHLLSLVTKGQVVVRQDGIDRMTPFGTIHVGVPVAGVESV